MLQDIDKEITLVNVIETADSLSHINALYEEVRFKDIQNKVFAEVKKEFYILLQHKSDFLENNEPSLRNSETNQGLMDQIAVLKGELEEKNRQILLRLTESWKAALDSNSFTGAVLMDLSKAFDCVSHNLLIAKLHAYTFSFEMLTFVSSYLSLILTAAITFVALGDEI